MQIKTAVFATSNNIEKIIVPLQSRFFIVKLQSYTYEQFYEITVNFLTRLYRVDIVVAKATANSVWGASRDVRDCVGIGKMSKSVEDVNWFTNTFLKDTNIS